MITYHELFVLNRALDGKDIINIPSFDNLQNRLAIIKESKKSLIKKKILKDENSFTVKGVQMVHWLGMYKAATHFLNLQSMWIALCENHRGIIIHQIKDGIIIHFIDTGDLLNTIRDKYPFINNTVAEKEEIRQTIAPRELFRMYYLEAQNGFLAESVIHQEKLVSCLYFELNKQNYRYDNRSHELVSVSGDTIQNELKQMIVCKRRI